MALCFRQDAYQIKWGLECLVISRRNKRRKTVQHLPDYDSNNVLIVNGNMIQCKSFPLFVWYSLLSDQTGLPSSTLSMCQPSFHLITHYCKHMFLISHIKNIPLRTHPSKYSPATRAPLQEGIDTNEINKYLQELLTDTNNRLYNHVTRKKLKRTTNN